MGQPDKVLGAPGVKIEPVFVVDKHVNRSAIVLHELHKCDLVGGAARHQDDVGTPLGKTLNSKESRWVHGRCEEDNA